MQNSWAKKICRKYWNCMCCYMVKQNKKKCFTLWIIFITDWLKERNKKKNNYLRSSKGPFDHQKSLWSTAHLWKSSLISGRRNTKDRQAGSLDCFCSHVCCVCLCVDVSSCMCVCVWGLLKSTLFSPWCFLVLSQSQSSVTGDKARLLRRQEEMELGSLERATHNCIYIILEGSSALNSCALISEVSCLHREGCGLFGELSL